jgi:hypothetical protein
MIKTEELISNQIKLNKEILSLLEKYSNLTSEQKRASAEITDEINGAREQSRERDVKKIGEIKEKIELLRTKKKSY